MVPEIAWLLEHAPAVRIHALEEQLLSLSHGVLDLDRLMPVRWNAFEVLWAIFYLLIRLLILGLMMLFFLRRLWLLKHLFLFLRNEFADDIFELCHVILHFRLPLRIFDLRLVPEFPQNFDESQLFLQKFLLVDIWSDARHSFAQTAFWKLGLMVDNLGYRGRVYASVILN
jgi:hypothetical protein